MNNITLEEIEEHVLKNGFYRHSSCIEFMADWYSEGIRYAVGNLKTENTGQIGHTHPFFLEVASACSRFNNNDFGDMYEEGETIVLGAEFGRYETCLGNIHIHREFDETVLYFPFER